LTLSIGSAILSALPTWIGPAASAQTARQSTDVDETPALVDDRGAAELRLVTALRDGDEAAFATLVDRHQASLVRIATIYVGDTGLAEDVVQDTWVAVLRGIDRFEGRSTLKTWIFRILANRARTRAEREGRSIPFSALWDLADEPGEPAVDPERFLPADHPRWPRHWSAPPRSWADVPEDHLLAAETRAQIATAIAALPSSQRLVITLRDVDGLTSEEACQVIGISEANQRVLLHRARARVRRALETYLAPS
jgi:RNA polymerase sigma-70 factor, ECF subfamily